MRAVFRHRAAGKHRNVVAELAAGESVGNVYGRLPSDHLLKLAVDLVLRDRVERRGRLVKNDNGRILIQCPGNRKLLLFPADGSIPSSSKYLNRIVSSPFFSEANLS